MKLVLDGAVGTGHRDGQPPDWLRFDVIHEGQEYPVYFWNQKSLWGRRRGVWAALNPADTVTSPEQELANSVELTGCEYQLLHNLLLRDKPPKFDMAIAMNLRPRYCAV